MKRLASFLMVGILTFGMCFYSYAAEVTDTADTTTTAKNTANTAVATGAPYKVGGYTKAEIRNMSAPRALMILKGGYRVYDSDGNQLGKASEIFNGVWDDIDPASIIEKGKDGKTITYGSSTFTPGGNLELKKNEKKTIDYGVPEEAKYADTRNVQGAPNSRFTTVSQLSPKVYGHVATYSKFYNEDHEEVKFTRVNGETY